jgi:hypothetical protein
MYSQRKTVMAHSVGKSEQQGAEQRRVKLTTGPMLSSVSATRKLLPTCATYIQIAGQSLRTDQLCY